MVRPEWIRVINRWPEYLVEVIVVMVSILAAFALDNWNDGRARQRVEISILRSAMSELASDLTDIDFNVRNHEQAIRSMDLIVEYLEGDSLYRDSLAVDFHNVTNTNTHWDARTLGNTINLRQNGDPNGAINTVAQFGSPSQVYGPRNIRFNVAYRF